ncbi:hypothetical protein [Streptomyces sp. NPDC002845]
MVATAALLLLLILAGAWYDTARLLASAGSRRPPRPRLPRRRAAVETAGRRLVVRRLHGRVDAATYRARMRSLPDEQCSPRREGHG